MINLLNLEPNKVSVDLEQYSMVWIGNSGEGKTYTLKEYLESLNPNKKPLFLMFEDRYQNIPGIMAQRIHNVSEFKAVLNQLKNPKLKEKFSSIVIDTIDKFEEMAEQFVTDNHEVQILDEVGGYGKGTRYFKKVLRAIGDLRNLGYPLHFVAQSSKNKDSETKIEKIDMKLSKNTLSYIKEGAFLVGYMWKEETNNGVERFITFSANETLPNLKDTFGLPQKINTKELKSVLESTISGLGADFTTKEKTIKEYQETVSFEELKAKGMQLGGLLAQNGYLEEATTVLKKNIGVEEDGSPKMFESLKEGQIDLIKVVIMELEELVSKYKLG